jgi:hypothetical protein
MFESDFISGTKRTALCEASVGPTLLHGAKCWIISRTDKKWWMCSTVKYYQEYIKERDKWRCGFNRRLYGLFKGPRLSVEIRIARLRWAGHVARMDEIECLGDLCICNQE